MSGRSRYIRRVRSVDHGKWARRRVAADVVAAVTERALAAARAGDYGPLDTLSERLSLAVRLALVANRHR